jgi:hypothetical protein
MPPSRRNCEQTTAWRLCGVQYPWPNSYSKSASLRTTILGLICETAVKQFTALMHKLLPVLIVVLRQVCSQHPSPALALEASKTLKPLRPLTVAPADSALVWSVPWLLARELAAAGRVGRTAGFSLALANGGSWSIGQRRKLYVLQCMVGASVEAISLAQGAFNAWALPP